MSCVPPRAGEWILVAFAAFATAVALATPHFHFVTHFVASVASYSTLIHSNTHTCTSKYTRANIHGKKLLRLKTELITFTLGTHKSARNDNTNAPTSK